CSCMSCGTVLLVLFLHLCRHHRDLHSFPTRRSSDLPEVDPDRIGIAGNSGGGTLVQYLLAVDPRVKAAMPACSFATRESYLATGVRAYDGEQNLFGAVSDSLDCTELIAAFAPRSEEHTSE